MKEVIKNFMNNRIMAMLFALVAAMFISIVPVKAEAVTPCTHKQTEWKSDVHEHRKVCKSCGEILVSSVKHDDVVYIENGATHTMKCRTCNFSVDKEHEAKKDGDSCRCSLCQTLVDHNYEQFKGADTHAMICKVCGNTKDQAAHTWTATDNGNGKHSKICSVCEKTVSEDHKDSSDDKDCVCDACGAAVETNHSPVEVAGKAATCTEPGVSGHLKCQYCGKLFSKSIPGKVLTETDVVVKALDHKAWSTWKTDEDGHYHGCQNAGCEEKLEYTEHTMEWEYDGTNKHWAECKVCHYKLEGENHTYVYTAKNGDKHDAECSVCGKVVENRDCVDENKDHKCDKCGDYLTHGYNEGYMGKEVYKKVTCTVDGTKTHKTCTVCGLILRPDGSVVTAADLVNKAIGHKMNEAWEWKQNAEGTAHFKYCANEGCDAHIYGTAEAVVEGEQAHAHGSWRTSETAHEEICSVCELTYGYEIHDYKDVQKGSVSSKGVQRHKLVCECGEGKLKGCSFNEQCVCKVCGDGKIHEWGPLKTLSAVAPTCTATGKIEAGQCTICQGIFKQENGKVVATTEAGRVIPALGHNWVASNTMDDADGKHVMTCSNVVNGKKCTKATVMDHYTNDEDCLCDVEGCNVVAHSHTFIQVTGKAPTCTEDGIAAYNKYAGCGRMFDLNNNEITEPVTIPATGHDTTADWTPGENGMHVKVCGDCGEIIASEAHNFQNRSVTCSVCGAEEGLTHVPAVAATCTQNGNVEYWTSLITGKKYADEAGTRLLTDVTVKATGHDMSGWEDMANGLGHKQVCMNGCGHELVENHDNVNGCFCTECGGFKNGHTNEMVEAVPATCAKAGTQAHFKCSCGKLYDLGFNAIEKAGSIAQLKHDMSTQVLKDAKEGKHYVQCKNCNYRMYEKHGMELSDPNKGNYHQWLCDCGELKIETHYDKNGDKKCDVCGHNMNGASQNTTVEQHDNQTVHTGQSSSVNTTKDWWWNWQEWFTPSNSGGSSATVTESAHESNTANSGAATGNTTTNNTTTNNAASNNTTTNNTTTNNSGNTTTPTVSAPAASETGVIAQFITWFLGLFGF